MDRKRQLKLAIWGASTGAVVALLLYILIPIYHVIHGTGILENHDQRKYEASNEKNLRAIYTAIKNYHETEDKYPDGAKWMDEIRSRIQAGDMSKEEAAKKLVNPLYPPKPGVYGYAINDQVAGKNRLDIKDPKAILVFDSSDTALNAHGDPKSLKPKSPSQGGDLAITIGGDLVRLP